METLDLETVVSRAQELAQHDKTPRRYIGASVIFPIAAVGLVQKKLDYGNSGLSQFPCQLSVGVFMKSESRDADDRFFS